MDCDQKITKMELFKILKITFNTNWSSADLFYYFLEKLHFNHILSYFDQDGKSSVYNIFTVMKKIEKNPKLNINQFDFIITPLEITF